MVKRLSAINIIMENFKKCCICGIEISKFGFNRHISRCDGRGPQRDRKKTTKKRIAWNKGLTADSDERVKINSEKSAETNKKLFENGLRKPSVMSQEARKRLSILQSEKNRGGKCVWHNINGISVQGTWELNVALKLNELNIEWRRGSPIEYEMNGKLKHYTPDFYLINENLFLEVKGYWWGDDKEKMDCIYNQYPDMKIVIVDKDKYKQFMRGELVW